jgi:uncharacterized membrane protein
VKKPNDYRTRLEQRANAKKQLYHHLRAKAEAERSFPVQFAKRLTELFGTLTFLLINAAIFVIWIIANANIIPGLEAFDPFPFGLLTTAVSLEAIILTIIVLIAQNRAAIIGDLREEVDLEIDVRSEAEITKLLELLTRLLEKNGVDLAGDRVLKEMLEPTNVEDIEETLKEQTQSE